MIDTKDKNAVYKAIVEILEADFEINKDELTPDARLFEDLDLDSIDAVDLVVKLQSVTGIKVDPEGFKQIRTVQDITDVVYNLLNK